MNNRPLYTFILSFSLAVMVLAGCAGKSEDSLDSLNGAWKSDGESRKIIFNINGKQKTVSLENNNYVIESDAVERESISIVVKDSSGKNLSWKFVRVWNDNGSEFTLNFLHDGKVEHLTKLTDAA